MRLFVAIELARDRKEKLSVLNQELSKSKADVKWVGMDAFHITLKFLGEVKIARIDEIKTRLKERLAGFLSTFKIEIKGIGVFPDFNRPRIVWVGIQGADPKIKQLYRKIEDVFFNLGFEKEKRAFTAHLTLGRVRSIKNKEKLIEKIEKFSDFSLGEMDVKEISLMESLLVPKGAKYVCLEKIKI